MTSDADVRLINSNLLGYNGGGSPGKKVWLMLNIN